MPDRFHVTEAAAQLVRALQARHGKLIFHLSGGCCEGSAPMCLRQTTFRIGAHDVLLGMVEGCPVYVAGAHFPIWADSDITLDVLAEGGGDSFSLEAANGSRFTLHSRPRESSVQAEKGVEVTASPATPSPPPEPSA